MIENRFPIRPARLDPELGYCEPDNILQRYDPSWEVNFVQISRSSSGVTPCAGGAKMHVRIDHVGRRLRVPMISNDFRAILIDAPTTEN